MGYDLLSDVEPKHRYVSVWNMPWMRIMMSTLCMAGDDVLKKLSFNDGGVVTPDEIELMLGAYDAIKKHKPEIIQAAAEATHQRKVLEYKAISEQMHADKDGDEAAAGDRFEKMMLDSFPSAAEMAEYFDGWVEYLRKKRDVGFTVA